MPKRNLIYKGNGQGEKLGKYRSLEVLYIIPDLNAVAVMKQNIDPAGHGGFLKREFHSRLHFLGLDSSG
jgi:hypothetical protein